MFLGLSALDFAAAEEGIGMFKELRVGEIAPVPAMALLVGTHGTCTILLVMVAFIGVAVLVAIASSAIVRAVPGISARIRIWSRLHESDRSTLDRFDQNYVNGGSDCF